MGMVWLLFQKVNYTCLLASLASQNINMWQITGQITDVTEPQASNDDPKVEEKRLSSMSKYDLVSELKTSSGKIKQLQILNRFVWRAYSQDLFNGLVGYSDHQPVASHLIIRYTDHHLTKSPFK